MNFLCEDILNQPIATSGLSSALLRGPDSPGLVQGIAAPRPRDARGEPYITSRAKVNGVPIAAVYNGVPGWGDGGQDQPMRTSLPSLLIKSACNLFEFGGGSNPLCCCYASILAARFDFMIPSPDAFWRGQYNRFINDMADSAFHYEESVKHEEMHGWHIMHMVGMLKNYFAKVGFICCHHQNPDRDDCNCLEEHMSAWINGWAGQIANDVGLYLHDRWTQNSKPQPVPTDKPGWSSASGSVTYRRVLKKNKAAMKRDLARRNMEELLNLHKTWRRGVSISDDCNCTCIPVKRAPFACLDEGR